MAHWRIEFDLARSWMNNSIMSFDTPLLNLKERLDDPQDFVDIDICLNETNQMLGIVACIGQTYITHALGDFYPESNNDPRKDTRKMDLIHICSPRVGNTSVSAVELIYHLANYWKHVGEWHNWKPNGRNKNTILGLEKVGISENTDYPCVRAFELIWPNSASDCLSGLSNILIAWRLEAIAYIREEGPLS